MTSAITQTDLSARFQRLRGALDRHVTDLNMGGCGVFALEMARCLRRMGIEHEILLPNQWGDDWYDGLQSPRRALESGRTLRDMRRGHVGVRYKLGARTYCMDSTRVRPGKFTFGRSESECAKLARNGAFKVTLSYPWGQGLTAQEFAPVVGQASAWNRRFDRKQIKLVRHLIHHYVELNLS